MHFQFPANNNNVANVRNVLDGSGISATYFRILILGVVTDPRTI